MTGAPLYTFQNTGGTVSTKPAVTNPGSAYQYCPNDGTSGIILSADWVNGLSDNFAEILVAGGQDPQTGNLLAALQAQFTGSGTDYLPLSGGTLTGALIINSGTTPQLKIESSGTMAYLDLQVQGYDAGVTHLYNSGAGDHSIYLGPTEGAIFSVSLSSPQVIAWEPMACENGLTVNYTSSGTQHGILTATSSGLAVTLPAAFNGGATSTTPASGDSSTKVATTAFVNPGSSLGANGYRTNPDGSIDQWGISAAIPTGSNTSNISITFPTPFPNAAFVCTANADNGANSSWAVANVTVISLTTTGATFHIDSANNSENITNTVHVYWRAIGN